MERKNRNSVIELSRLFFSLWVVYTHGFCPQNPFFTYGFLAVEYFFILSGFFFMDSMKKYLAMPFWKGLYCLYVSRLKGIAMPFLIGLICFFWEGVLTNNRSIFGYLWFIPDMIIVQLCIYTIYRFSDRKKFFFLLFSLSIGGLFASRFYGRSLDNIGIFRAIVCISIGILFSEFKKTDLKKLIFKKNDTLETIYIVLSAIICSLFCLYIMWNPDKKEGSGLIYLLIFTVYPCTILSLSNISFSSAIADSLGHVGFSLYSFQGILVLLRFYNLENDKLHLFIILLGAGLLYEAIHITYVSVQEKKSKKIKIPVWNNNLLRLSHKF